VVKKPGYILDGLSGVAPELSCGVAKNMKAGSRQPSSFEITPEASVERTGG
jgi:hypothetical protein